MIAYVIIKLKKVVLVKGGEILKKKKTLLKSSLLSLGLASYLLFRNQPETIVLKEPVSEKK